MKTHLHNYDHISYKCISYSENLEITTCHILKDVDQVRSTGGLTVDIELQP